MKKSNRMKKLIEKIKNTKNFFKCKNYKREDIRNIDNIPVLCWNCERYIKCYMNELIKLKTDRPFIDFMLGGLRDNFEQENMKE